MQKKLKATNILIAAAFLSTACHKTFFNDEGSFVTPVPKMEAPKAPVEDEPTALPEISKTEMRVDCVYETSSNLKLQILLNTESKEVLGVSVYDTTKNETTKDTFTKALTQKTEKRIQTVEFADGTTLEMTTKLFKKDHQADVLINDEDIFNCNVTKLSEP